jgi:competence protein ComEC
MNINWHEIPFFRILFPFLIGLILSIYWVNYLPVLWYACGFSIFVLIMMQNYLKGFYASKAFGIVATLALFLFGFQIGSSYDERHSGDFFIKKVEKTSRLVVQITEMPTVDKWVKFRAKVLMVDSSQTSGDLLVYVKKDSLSEQFNYGDQLLLKGWINEINAPQNPNQFDYQSYLHFKNLHYQTFIQADSWQTIDKNKGNFFYATLFKMRKGGLQTLQKHLSERSYSVGAALILGYREALSEDIQKAYTDSGAIHVLAVSGLHVGIIALILQYLLKLFFRGKNKYSKLQPVIVIAGLWLFALLTGGSPSVLRAATMFSFVTWGMYTKTSNSVYNNLAASAFILLCWNPYLIKSVGFQLSYLAVLGIVYFQPIIYRLWYIPNGSWRKLSNYPTNILHYIWTLTTVAIGAQIGTLPVTLYYFHQFPSLFWLSGLVVIPAAMLILSLGLATMILEMISDWLAAPFGYLLDCVIEIVNKAIFALNTLPIGKIDSIQMSGLGMLLLFGIIGSLIFTLENYKKLASAHINQSHLSIKKAMGKGIFVALFFAVALSALYAFNHFQTQKQTEIIIYNIRNHTLIEAIDGEKTYSIQSDSIDKKSVEFATAGYHIAKGIREKQLVSFGEKLKNDKIFYSDNILFYNNLKFLILNEAVNLEKIDKLKVDYVLLVDNVFLDLKALKGKITFEELIFDASNKSKSIRYWRKTCKKLEIDYYDITADGAWRK